MKNLLRANLLFLIFILSGVVAMANSNSSELCPSGLSFALDREGNSYCLFDLFHHPQACRYISGSGSVKYDMLVFQAPAGFACPENPDVIQDSKNSTC